MNDEGTAVGVLVIRKPPPNLDPWSQVITSLGLSRVILEHSYLVNWKRWNCMGLPFWFHLDADDRTGNRQQVTPSKQSSSWRRRICIWAVMVKCATLEQQGPSVYQHNNKNNNNRQNRPEEPGITKGTQPKRLASSMGPASNIRNSKDGSWLTNLHWILLFCHISQDWRIGRLWLFGPLWHVHCSSFPVVLRQISPDETAQVVFASQAVVPPAPEVGTVCILFF